MQAWIPTAAVSRRVRRHRYRFRPAASTPRGAACPQRRDGLPPGFPPLLGAAPWRFGAESHPGGPASSRPRCPRRRPAVTGLLLWAGSYGIVTYVSGGVVQRPSTLACQARDRGFESRRFRQVDTAALRRSCGVCLWPPLSPDRYDRMAGCPCRRKPTKGAATLRPSAGGA